MSINKIPIWLLTPALVPVLVLLTLSPHAIGEPEPTKVEPTQAESSPPTKDKDTLPSLDELLGIENKNDQRADKPIEDANDAELDRVLSAEQAGEAFSQAVKLMDQVASRITDNADLSLTTQRLQEDILSKLDKVIESAQKNDSGGGGGSSSSSQSSSSQKNQPNQQQAQEGEGSKPSSNSGDAPMPAGSSTARPGDEIAPDGVSWGALPERFREALSQGISDRYSELYRSITEQFYKSLAEDE